MLTGKGTSQSICKHDFKTRIEKTPHNRNRKGIYKSTSQGTFKSNFKETLTNQAVHITFKSQFKGTLIIES